MHWLRPPWTGGSLGILLCATLIVSIGLRPQERSYPTTPQAQRVLGAEEDYQDLPPPPTASALPRPHEELAGRPGHRYLLSRGQWDEVGGENEEEEPQQQPRGGAGDRCAAALSAICCKLMSALDEEQRGGAVEVPEGVREQKDAAVLSATCVDVCAAN